MPIKASDLSEEELRVLVFKAQQIVDKRFSPKETPVLYVQTSIAKIRYLLCKGVLVCGFVHDHL